MEVLGAEALKILRKPGGPQNRQIGLRRGPEILQGVEIAVGHLVTMWRPSMPTPPMDSVTQVGSPENRELYSGVRANFTRRSFMIK